MSLIAVAGDIEPYSDAHVPPTGGGNKTIPGTLQTFVRIAGKPIILQGQTFGTNCPICFASCTAGATGASRLVRINGIPVCRAGDVGEDGAHDGGGIVVSGQAFVHDRS